MTTEITIPLLPCHAIDEMLEFYTALGFDITYRQARPNVYAVVCRGGIELHFFSMKGYDPAQSYSTCYVRVSDVDGLYQAFTGGLRQKYGRLPSAGIPRVIPLKNKTGRREFIIIDPGGNWIRIGQPTETPDTEEVPKEPASPLSRALNAAILLSDAGQDDKAATMLDNALAQEPSGPSLHRVRALVYRAGLAITLGDHPLAGQLLTDMRQITVQDSDRSALAEEFQRARDLEAMLQQH